MFKGLVQGDITGLRKGLQKGHRGLERGLVGGLNPSVSYDSDVAAYFRKLQDGASGVVIPQFWKTAVNEFITNIKAKGIYNLCDVIYLMIGGTATSNSIEFKSLTSYGLTYAGCTHSLLGIKGDASGNINTNWNPATNGVKYTQNSASAGTYTNVNNAVMTGGKAFFGNGTDAHALSFDIIGGPAAYLSVNSASDASSFTLTSSGGFYSLTRTASSGAGAVKAYWNGYTKDSITSTSGAIVSRNIYLLAENTGVGVGSGNWGDNRVCFFYAGSGSVNQMELFTEVENLQVALGRSAYGG